MLFVGLGNMARVATGGGEVSPQLLPPSLAEAHPLRADVEGIFAAGGNGSERSCNNDERMHEAKLWNENTSGGRPLFCESLTIGRDGHGRGRTSVLCG
jgi:hypothetical protein